MAKGGPEHIAPFACGAECGSPPPFEPSESRDSRPGHTVPARHRFQRTPRPPTRSRPPATRRRTWGGGKLDEWRGAGGGADDSDGGAADTRGSAVMRREERGGTVVAAWMSALLSSSSRAVSTWPLAADTLRAVTPACGHARRGVGRRARDRGVGGRQGSWRARTPAARACPCMGVCV